MPKSAKKSNRLSRYTMVTLYSQKHSDWYTLKLTRLEFQSLLIHMARTRKYSFRIPPSLLMLETALSLMPGWLSGKRMDAHLSRLKKNSKSARSSHSGKQTSVNHKKIRHKDRSKVTIEITTNDMSELTDEILANALLELAYMIEDSGYIDSGLH